jgi:hypothetical protein
MLSTGMLALLATSYVRYLTNRKLFYAESGPSFGTAAVHIGVSLGSEVSTHGFRSYRPANWDTLHGT